MDIKWTVVVNVAHEGRVTSVDWDDVWTNENPTGWTNQELTGPHGAILDWYDSNAEAAAALAKWEECDAPVNGTYCYAHNHAAW